jgi:fluoride ion exporter CrcB/FEX
MYPTPLKSILALVSGSIAGALLRYLTALAPPGSTSPMPTIVVSAVGGAILGALLGSVLPKPNERAGRWPRTILLVATIAGFGVTAALQTPLAAEGDEILRAALINIAATILAAVCATGVTLRLRRT